MLNFFIFFCINLTINVAHPVFLMHIQSLLSGYAPAVHILTYTCICVRALLGERTTSLISVLILLDLSAAFDTVNHQMAWGAEVSKAHQLVTGVPQGSVLGPPSSLSTYYITGSIIQAHGFSYHFTLMTQLYLSF